MNASTPSPSSSPPAPVSAPLSSPARGRAMPAFLRPVLSCGGAVLLGGLLVHLFPFSPATPADSSSVASTQAPILMALPRSQMRTAHLAPLAPRILLGSFHLTTDVTGRAPASGEVARQLVSVGTHVEAGDRVLEVSSGAASRPAPAAETQQTDAEREQVAAVQGQNALSQQLSQAQMQLSAAQERVTQAKERVASTRSLVKRLLAGEQIPAAGGAGRTPARKLRRRKRERISPQTSEQTRSEEGVAGASSALDDAQAERDDARGAVTSAQKKVERSKQALQKAEGDFKAEKVTADVLQNARADADDATSALQTAQARAAAADKTRARRQSQVEAARSLAQKTREAKSDPPQTEAADAKTPDASDEAPTGKAYLTADQAVAMAAAALKESKTATRAADRMRARVNLYEQQVRSTSQRMESATQDLQSAQQHEMDTPVRAMFTTARAPRSGTITWMSRLAREVSAGEAVFGMSQGNGGFLRFQDKGTAWQALKVGQTLNAAPTTTPSPTQTTPAQMSSATSTTRASTARATAPAALPVSSGASPSTAAPPVATGVGAEVFSVRITRITPPSTQGEAAQIDAVRLDGAASSDAVAGQVQVELPAEAVSSSRGSAPSGSAPSGSAPSGSTSSGNTVAAVPRFVVVPASVVLPRDGVDYVAVASPSLASSTGAGRLKGSTAQMMTLSWRPVQVTRQTPFDVEIKTGVRDGEQVVNQPAILLSRWKPEDKKTLPVSLDASS